jgi:hypothetical protein
MGTTADAIRSQDGVELGFVLCIEGYPKLITDGMPSDATTAWSGSLWSEAVSSLEMSFYTNQRLEPFSNEFQVPSMQFTIYDEDFAVDMFRSKPSVRTELKVGFDSGDSTGGGYNIQVRDGSQFATGGVAYIGNEAFKLATPTSTLLPIATNGEGYYHPFSGDTGAANRFPGAHSVGANVNVNSVDVNAPVYVTDAPATWIGKKVALHAHRIVGGVWDTKAQSEVLFAGSIDTINPGDGGIGVQLQCMGITQALKDATLMRDQWSAQPAEGFTFKDGDFIRVMFVDSTTAQSARLTAATPGTGPDEFPSGRYSAQEFGTKLAQHLNGDTTVGPASSLGLSWTAGVVSSDGGSRFQIAANKVTSVDGASITMIASPPALYDFLGYDYSGGSGGWITDGTVKTGPRNPSTTTVSIISERPPMRFAAIGLGDAIEGATLDLEDADGTFVDHTSILPPSAQELANDGGVWSFFSLGDSVVFLGKVDSATAPTKITEITTEIPLAEMVKDKRKAGVALTAGDAASARVKQIFFAADTFTNLIAKLFASVDGQGVNHATYDAFPFGAGIPWGLLGDSFIHSLEDLEQAGVEDSVALVIEKPTKLWHALKSDFALRMAGPVWKDGGIRIAQLGIPNASTADHTFDETNKSDTHYTRQRESTQYLTHTLKILFNRNPLTDKYQDEIVVRNLAAYDSAGGRGQTKTIKARNSYSGVAASGASVERLADTLAAVYLPVFGRPMKVWERGMAHKWWHAAPGESAVVSDDRLRDPTTGQLGLSQRAATIISTSYSPGVSTKEGYFGSVELLYSEEDRLFPVAPTCEHATATGTATGRNWTSGYDDEAGTAGVFSLLVAQHAFSDSTESNDSTHMAAGDAVRVIEADPANASASTFTDTIASITQDVATISTVDYDEIVLTNGFGNGGRPAFDSTKTYYVVPDEYDSCQESQQLVAFQADSGDGLIGAATIDANLVGGKQKLGSASADITLLPERYASKHIADGYPFPSHLMRQFCRMSNNLTNYKTAPHMPMITQSETVVSTSGSSEYIVLWTIPFYIGNEYWPGGRKRTLNVAPYFRSGDGVTSVTVRVTSSANQPEGSSYTDTSWHGPKNQITFSTTSSTFAIATAQELDIVRAASPNPNEITWLTVEANDLVGFKGLGELWLGPLQ